MYLNQNGAEIHDKLQYNKCKWSLTLLKAIFSMVLCIHSLSLTRHKPSVNALFTSKIQH